jgi:hypothetical protein
MSLRLTTPWISTNIPGAYPNVSVQSSPSALGQSGIIVIMGEADGGDSFKNVVLSQNTFSPDQFAKVQQIYTAGPIVDAMQALASPSADTDISGSANLIYIVKTNTGVQASAIVDTDYGTFKSKNWGTAGNSFKYNITSIASEVAPSLSGGTIPSLGATLNGMAFTIRLEGAVASVVTLSGTTGSHDTISHLVTELNGLLPAGIVAAAGTAVSSIKLTISSDSAANRKGWGKSFELIDSVPGDLAALGLVVGLVVSSVEPGVEVNVVNSSANVNENIDVNAVIALSIGCVATTCTLTLSSVGLLTTTAVGGPASLSIDTTKYQTLADLASFISSQSGYTAVASAAAQQLPSSALDLVTAIGIASSGAGLMPGRVKKAASDFQKAMATSGSLNFTVTASTGSAGLPSVTSQSVWLSGGLRGATLAADIVSALTQIGGIQCNIIVPLFSRDASLDLTAGLTDSQSTYTIAAVNAAVKSHCITFSTPKLKRNRICILSIMDTYQNAKTAAQSLGNYRCSMTMQQITQSNSVGAIVSFQPWYAACLAAGMQAGGFYKAIVNKAANVISFTDPSGFDSGSPGNVEDALSAGLLFLSKDTSREYWVSDQTTFGFDSSFVYNSIQAVYCSDLIALDLAQSFQVAFVGKSLADVDAAVGLTFLAQKMSGYKNLKLIASSTDAPLGYKNPKVTILAPNMEVGVEIKLATAIYFIPISINISQVQSAV